jgi:hypothetical protein
MQALLAAIVAGVLAYLFITAALVTTTVRMVAGFWPRFSKALLCSLILFVVTLIVSSALQPIVGAGNGWAPTSGIMLVINAVVVNGLIRRPDGTRIGFVSAALASLIQTAFEMALLLLLLVALGISLLEAILLAH